MFRWIILKLIHKFCNCFSDSQRCFKLDCHWCEKLTVSTSFRIWSWQLQLKRRPVRCLNGNGSPNLDSIFENMCQWTQTINGCNLLQIFCQSNSNYLENMWTKRIKGKFGNIKDRVYPRRAIKPSDKDDKLSGLYFLFVSEIKIFNGNPWFNLYLWTYYRMFIFSCFFEGYQHGQIRIICRKLLNNSINFTSHFYKPRFW